MQIMSRLIEAAVAAKVRHCHLQVRKGSEPSQTKKILCIQGCGLNGSCSTKIKTEKFLLERLEAFRKNFHQRNFPLYWCIKRFRMIATMYMAQQQYNMKGTYLCLASFPGRSTVQFLIACDRKLDDKKAWE